ncbi:putative hydroxypyruvate isomerase [Aricia agestis]|uniref:putative hydroxypyruvate isomerase n=1 Tax=Aricia agestis TaxID=91739 RepID=UPI001C202F16|nr:putative hydroxypyruvate isomerase [Aricia agestis]XP_041982989.1 putative hydroxypyruvate isomerase [Aricia agestis]
MKFCANLSFMFTEGVSILERYALAKEAGFKAVETGFPFGHTLEEVKQAKENSGVEQVLINLKTGDLSKGELGVTAVPGKENEFRDNLKTTIDYAKAVGAKKIHIMAGKLDTVSAKNWETYENNLKYAANLLKNDNIVGVIEPINQHSVPKYFLSDYGKAVEIIKRINSEHLKLQLDIFHLQHICGDLSYNIKDLMPYVGHVQIAQVPNRNEPDTDGEINYQYILKEIQKNGYNDWIGLEYKPAGSSRDGLKWIKDFGYQL